MISVVIPAYNEEKYIENTLKNLPEEVEIIVVCDACTDKTMSIAEKYAKTYAIKEKNVSKARNYGGSKSKGDIIIFLDADTQISRNFINRIERIGKKNFFGTCRVKPDNNKIMANLYASMKNITGLHG